MRKFARSIWVCFANQGVTLADKWGQADANFKTQYYSTMNKRFPELKLCELDWKADQIAQEMYSGWRMQWLNKLEKAKGLDSELPKRSVSNSIHLFRHYISPTYSTLLLALWMIKVALLVKAAICLSRPFSLQISSGYRWFRVLYRWIIDIQIVFDLQQIFLRD
jgi:hypothetical protein